MINKGGATFIDHQTTSSFCHQKVPLCQDSTADVLNEKKKRTQIGILMVHFTLYIKYYNTTTFYFEVVRRVPSSRQFPGYFTPLYRTSRSGVIGKWVKQPNADPLPGHSATNLTEGSLSPFPI